jgi:hypothetical protein
MRKKGAEKQYGGGAEIGHGRITTAKAGCGYSKHLKRSFLSPNDYLILASL